MYPVSRLPGIGLLGFLSTDDVQAAGNWGLWDQRLALQWVSANIRAFGGDPGKVTLAGSTTGAFCAVYQAMFPPNQGLFRRVLLESGTPLSASGFRLQGRPYAQAVAEELGCAQPLTSSAIVTCLRGVDYTALLASTVTSPEPFMLPWIPVVDRDFILTSPLDAFTWPPARPPLATFRSVDALLGTTSSDGAVLVDVFLRSVAAGRGENLTAGVTRPFFEEVVGLVGDTAGVRRLGGEVKVTTQAVVQEYRDWENQDDPVAQANAMVQLLTDTGFYMPSAIVSRTHAEGNNASSTYVYEFHQRAFSPASFPWLRGSLHNDHNPFVLGLPESLMSGASLDVATPEGSALWNFSKSVMTYWSNFVKSGNPNTPEPVTVEWPPFSTSTESYLRLLSGATEASSHCRARRTRFWLTYLPTLQEAFREARQDSSTGTSSATDPVVSDPLYSTLGLGVVGVAVVSKAALL